MFSDARVRHRHTPRPENTPCARAPGDSLLGLKPLSCSRWPQLRVLRPARTPRRRRISGDGAATYVIAPPVRRIRGAHGAAVGDARPNPASGFSAELQKQDARRHTRTKKNFSPDAPAAQSRTARAVTPARPESTQNKPRRTTRRQTEGSGRRCERRTTHCSQSDGPSTDSRKSHSHRDPLRRSRPPRHRPPRVRASRTHDRNTA